METLVQIIMLLLLYITVGVLVADYSSMYSTKTDLVVVLLWPILLLSFIFMLILIPGDDEEEEN